MGRVKYGVQQMGLWVVLALCGCSTSQTANYYTLHAKAPKGPSVQATVLPSTEEKKRALGVGPVAIPGFWKSQAVVSFESPHKVTVPNHEFWAEDMERMTTRLFAQVLRQTYPEVSVRDFPWGHKLRPDQTVTLQIHHVGGSLKGSVELHLSWVWYEGETPAQTYSGQWQVTSSGGYESYVQALNGLFMLAAEAVAESWQP